MIFHLLILIFDSSLSLTISLCAYYSFTRTPHLWLYAQNKCNAEQCLPNNATLSIDFVLRNYEQGPNMVYAASASANNTVFMGMGTSKLAATLSSFLGFLDKPYMGYSETSPVLSDKLQYPTFLRVCPPDQLQGNALAAIIENFKFSHINIIYTNDIYGESLSRLISMRVGGIAKIALSRSYNSEGGFDEVDQVVKDIVESKAKINIMATYAYEPTMRSLFKSIALRNAFNGYGWIFSESIISMSNQSVFKGYNGLIGTQPGYNYTRFQTFIDEYNNKDVTIHKQYESRLGPYFNASGGFDPFAYDAIWAIIYGIRDTLINKENPYNGTLLRRRMLQLKFEGLSGTVYFDSSGDRLGSLIQVMNLNGGGWQVCGRWVDKTGLELTKEILWPGGVYSIPFSVDANVPSTKSGGLDFIIILSIIIAALVLGIVLIISLYCYKRNERLLRIAPDGNVCLVFTDIQSSTELWLLHPLEMKEAIDLHEKLIRKHISYYKGYEVKTIGDSFMVAFDSCINAIMFCSAVNTDLLYVKWPNGILDHEVCEVVIGKNGNVIYRGLRIRMGIHVGEMESRLNHRSGTVDYFGTNVNVAARIVSIANGGQILMSQAVFDEITRSRTDSTFTSLNTNHSPIYIGPCLLKGLGSYEIYEYKVDFLEERSFPPIQPRPIIQPFKEDMICKKCSNIVKCQCEQSPKLQPDIKSITTKYLEKSNSLITNSII